MDVASDTHHLGIVELKGGVEPGSAHASSGGARVGPCRVVILAGGYGTRLAERTDLLPKPMVEIGGRPLLWHILKIYSRHGFNDFVIACGYKADLIKRFFLQYRDQSSDLVIDFATGRVERLSETVEPWRVALVDTGEETMTGGRLRRLARHLDGETFLMTYGDGVADVDLPLLLEFHRAHGKLVTFTAVPAPSQYGRPRLEGDRVVNFTEKPLDRDQWINGGFFAIERRALDEIEGDHTSLERDLLPRLAKRGEVMAYRHLGFWHSMDTLRDVNNLNRLWSQPSPPWRVWQK